MLYELIRFLLTHNNIIMTTYYCLYYYYNQILFWFISLLNKICFKMMSTNTANSVQKINIKLNFFNRYIYNLTFYSIIWHFILRYSTNKNLYSSGLEYDSELRWKPVGIVFYYVTLGSNWVSDCSVASQISQSWASEDTVLSSHTYFLPRMTRPSTVWWDKSVGWESLDSFVYRLRVNGTALNLSCHLPYLYYLS